MTTAPTPASAEALSPAEAELQARARAFADEVLIPLEEEAERAHGRLPADAIAHVKNESLERRLSGGLHRAEHGGQSWTHVEWFLVEEQFGRSTNAISWHVPTGYNVLAHGSPEQIDRYLRPGLRVTVLWDDIVAAAPVVTAEPWQNEGNALTGPAPQITGTEPSQQVELTPCLLQPGRRYLMLAGPHFRAGGTFEGLELRILPREPQKPVYQFALLSDTHLGAGRATWMNVKMDGPAPR